LPGISVMSRILHWANASPVRSPRSKALYHRLIRPRMGMCLVRGHRDHQSWYWTVLGTGPLVRTASSRGGPVLDLGTGRPVLS
jgi:hypothetical protein